LAARSASRIVLPYTFIPCGPTDAFPRQKVMARPQLQVSLKYKRQSLKFGFPSIIDSGADHCMFPAQFGERIGIPIREGKVQATFGIGEDTAYFHRVRVLVELAGQVCYFHCYAGFMYSLDRIGIGLLGRHGFFELFESIAFKDSASVVELIPLQSPESARRHR